MMSQNFEIPAQPAASERKLDVFLGRWHTTGRSQGGNGFAAGRIDLRDNFEWMPGEVMFVHAWLGTVGDEQCKGLEICTHDPAKGKYFSHFFTNPNIGRVYEMTIDAAGVWTQTGPTERGRYLFEGADEFTGIWEQSEDGIRWTPLCDFRSRRVG